jgi:predicted RNase H-like HicB family nuclease
VKTHIATQSPNTQLCELAGIQILGKTAAHDYQLSTGRKPDARTFGRIGLLRVMQQTFTAILTREDGGFVALCPEVDVASQGATVEEAKANLKEAVELFFECASGEEVRQRGSHMVMQRPIKGGTITIPVPDHSELRTGTLRSIIRQSGLAVEEFR